MEYVYISASILVSNGQEYTMFNLHKTAQGAIHQITLARREVYKKRTKTITKEVRIYRVPGLNEIGWLLDLELKVANMNEYWELILDWKREL